MAEARKGVILLATRGKFWTFRAAADDPGIGELLLYGPISEVSWLGDEVTPKQFHEDLQALGDISELRVYINSGGGDVFAAQAIHSMLRRHKARKVVYIDGIAASAASLVAVAGDVVRMPRNAMIMVHNPFTMAVGDAAFLRQVADSLDQVREAMVAAYQQKTELSRRRLIALMDAETWMTAEEAVELGFADEIEEAKQVQASLQGSLLVVNGVTVDLGLYRNRPQLAGVQHDGTPADAQAGRVGVGAVYVVRDPAALAGAVADAVGRMLTRPQAGVVPEDVSEELAPEDEPWEAPTLSDFTDKPWEELSDAEKRRVAGHYAWAPKMPPDRFSDLKLPHHRPSDGKVVWRGVTAAAQRLDQTDIPDADKPRVRAHLQRHYHQFGRKAPWEQEDATSRLRLLALELELLAGRHA